MKCDYPASDAGLCVWLPPGPPGSASYWDNKATEERSNEITAIPLLLKALDLDGALVTIDAMGTQSRIAQAIRDGGGHYVLSLKENWPATLAEVEMLFDKPPSGMAFETHQTIDGCNGRIATRRHSVCYQVDWMTAGRRYPGEPRFPDLAMIGRIDSEVERTGKIERETRYYLSSAKLSAEKFGQASLVYEHNPTAMHLRAMNMLYEAIKEKGAMVIVPSSAVETMGLGGMLGTASLGGSKVQ